ncbi:MAG: hypothetical protein PHZ25_03400 [Candidatus Pacebacteria bacterium]|nr:hypothetical protein [Candidatus Paceibacterota bacterium]
MKKPIEIPRDLSESSPVPFTLSLAEKISSQPPEVLGNQTYVEYTASTNSGDYTNDDA